MKKYTQGVSEVVKSATDKLVNFIKPTFGPLGKGIIIQDGLGFKSVDDGVSIAKEFELKDEFENSIVQFIKEVAIKTNERVGDGTTGSLIILQSLINRISYEDLADLEKGLQIFKEQIKEKSIKVSTKEEIKNIAYISFNNEKIAEIIAEIVKEIGDDGVISVEDSNSIETTYEVVKGMQFDRGYISSHFVSNKEKMEAVLENPYILVTDKKISSFQEILPLLEKVFKLEKKGLVIIADDMDGDALGALILGKLQGAFNVVVIKAPGFGDRKKEMLEDIACLTGATFISEEKGMRIENVDVFALGQARKVSSLHNRTTIVEGRGVQENIDARIEEIRERIKNATSEFDKEKLQERLAKIVGGVGVIKVGASTESEAKMLKYKIEDAVNASQAASRGGYVKGAGIALSKIKTETILDDSLKAPLEQIKASGIDITKVDANVIDPTEVIIAQVESAVSIAKVLITSSGILINEHVSKNQ